MASVVASRCSGLLLPPSLAGVRRRSLAPSSLRLRPRRSRRRPGTLACVAPPDSAEPQTDEQDVKAESTEEPAQTSSAPEDAGLPALPNKDLNRRVALLSTLGAVALFASQRLDLGEASLKDLAATAVPYEEALSNGKPTVVEFYADWCEVCRELAPDVYKVEQQYKDRVNFVMLNVDNTKWEQELDEFGVEGIPHFAFLDKEGNEEGNVVGRLPRQYFLENVVALASGDPNIPHALSVNFQVQNLGKFMQFLIPEVMASNSCLWLAVLFEMSRPFDMRRSWAIIYANSVVVSSMRALARTSIFHKSQNIRLLQSCIATRQWDSGIHLQR